MNHKTFESYIASMGSVDQQSSGAVLDCLEEDCQWKYLFQSSFSSLSSFHSSVQHWRDAIHKHLTHPHPSNPNKTLLDLIETPLAHMLHDHSHPFGKTAQQFILFITSKHSHSSSPENIQKDTRSFISTFLNVLHHNISEIAQFPSSQRSHCIACTRNLPQFGVPSNDAMGAAGRALGISVHSQLYPLLFPFYVETFRKEDESMQKLPQVLLSDFFDEMGLQRGIQEKVVLEMGRVPLPTRNRDECICNWESDMKQFERADNPFLPAIESFKRLEYKLNPIEKLDVLLQTSRLVYECASKLPKAKKGWILSADDLVPLFAFIIVRSRITSLYAQIAYMDGFIDTTARMSIIGYYMVTLKAALQWLQSIKTDHSQKN